MSTRGRDSREEDQSSSGVGADDRDRQGQRIQDPQSIWARGARRSTRKPTQGELTKNFGSGPHPDKSGRGSTIDVGTRASRSEKSDGTRKRSGSRSNRS